MTDPGGPARAVVDIWRFEDQQIVEHWDVVQPEVH
jgi:predicted SnoaL-like aldol condensation-catalyzing enzyme